MINFFQITGSEEVATESKANLDKLITISLASLATNYSHCGNHDSTSKVDESC